jgi:hypothetical protein
MAMAVTSRVPMIKGKKPKSPLIGCQDEEKRRWERVVLARIGLALIKRMTAMVNAMAFTKTKEKRIEIVEKLSLNLLASTGVFVSPYLSSFFKDSFICFGVILM